MKFAQMLNTLDNHAPLFIVGCYRSGTSLLRLMLNAHSKVYIPEETQYIPVIGAKLNEYSNLESDNTFFRLMSSINKYLKYSWRGWNEIPSSEVMLARVKKRTFQDVVMHVNTYYNTKNTIEIWGDKTPLYVNSIIFLGKLFPRAKFINMVRDGRDVIVSALRAKLGGNNLTDISLEWNECVLNGLLAEKYFGSERVKTVRYEDLVSDPKKKLLSICEYLNIGYEESMIRYYTTSDAQVLSRSKHHNNVVKPISSDSVSSHKKVLKQGQRKVLESYMGNTLTTYGYDLEFDFQLPPSKYYRYLALFHSCIKLILRSVLRKIVRRVWFFRKKGGVV